MDLSKRVVLLKASVKEGEYPAFNPEDIIFLFAEVLCPEGVILNHTDPTECYVLFPPLIQLDEVYNLNRDPSWVGGPMALSIRQPPSSAINIVNKLVEFFFYLHDSLHGTACRIDIMGGMLCHVACPCWTSRMFPRGMLY